VTTPLKAFRQGIFDIVVERGSAMTARCLDRYGNCAYRDGKGNACWAGLLMSDEEAVGEDGKTHIGSVYGLYREGVLPERYHEHLDLLASLQRVHDEYTNWDNIELPNGMTQFGHGAPRKDRIAAALREVARVHGLDAKTVDQFYPA
jgi:hypothetical protein